MLLFSANREQLWYIIIIISNMAFPRFIVIGGESDDGGGTWYLRITSLYKYTTYTIHGIFLQQAMPASCMPAMLHNSISVQDKVAGTQFKYNANKLIIFCPFYFCIPLSKRSF